MATQPGTMMKRAKFEVWQNAAGEWQWHLRASNGEIIAVGEGYKRRQGAVQGTRAVLDPEAAPR